MANNRSVNTIILPADIFTGAMPQVGVTEKEVTQFMGVMSCVSTLWNNQLQEALNNRMLKSFLSAVVDDDRELVRKILDKSPDLLLISPPVNLIIESQHTWQKFYAESSLKMAAKRKQIELIKIMLTYLDKLEQTEDLISTKNEALASWEVYEIEKNAYDEDEIVIPQEYANYVQSLIDVFKVETFPNGVPGKNDISFNVPLSEETELALSSLFNRLLPEKAVKLDDYLDPELFLMALYKGSYIFNTFQDSEQLDAFFIRTIGLVQSVLSPETAKIFCEGLYNVVEIGGNISTRAASLKLFHGESFYRPSRESVSGLGFENLVASGCRSRGVNPFGAARAFGEWIKYVKQKQQTWKNYASRVELLRIDRVFDLVR